MSIIVRRFQSLVLELENLARLPPTDEIRPAACLGCRSAAGLPGALNLIGHGTYQRQVLGAAAAAESVVIHVRRFLCRACKRTVSILPDELHPRRWYSAAAILLALSLSLLRGKLADEVRRHFGAQSENRRWRTLERWKRQLLCSLWAWRAAELGHAAASPPRDDVESASRLRRLLNRHGASDRSPPDEIAAAARAATTNTAHTCTESWPMGHVH